MGLFGIAYGVISLAWPKLPTTTTTVIAVLVAAPAALGLIWPQLTAFKAFGVEVSLEHASERAIEPGLVDSLEAAFMTPVTFSLESLTKPDFSAPPFQESQPWRILDHLRIAATERLLPIDLGGGDKWWSTRLYLLAAIARDFLPVPKFVFTAHYPRDEFVGMASPSALKMALGLMLPPAVDEAYDTSRREAANLLPDDRLSHIFKRFIELISPIEQLADPAAARSADPWVTGDQLYTWLAAAGKELDTRAIVATGLSYEQLTLAVALDTSERYIALVAATRELELIVDRLDVFAQAAGRRHRPRLRIGRRASKDDSSARL